MNASSLPPDAELARRRLAVAASAVLAVLVVVAAFIVWQLLSISSNVRPPRDVAEEVRAELSAPERPSQESASASETAPTYVLVMGGETDGPLTTLMLVRVSSGTNVQASVLWIPPHAKVTAEGEAGSVSDAYVSEGPAAAIRRVKRLTGLPVHHYVRFAPAGLADAIDSMGGVRVDPSLVAERPTSPDAPPVARKGERVLNGDAVLAFASDCTVGGSSGPKALLVVNAALTQAKERLLSPSAIPLLIAASKSTETDMGTRGLIELGEHMRRADGAAVEQYHLVGPMQGGVMQLRSERRQVRRIVALFAEDGPTG